jgi:hypothetical protein
MMKCAEMFFGNLLNRLWATRLLSIFPCFADPWKIRMIAYFNSPPDLKELAEALDTRYCESLGVVLVRLG